MGLFGEGVEVRIFIYLYQVLLGQVSYLLKAGM